MSAYLCEDEHFRQLAAWLSNDDRSGLDWLARRVNYRTGTIEQGELATHIARILKDENIRSLGARYGEGDTDGANDFEAKFIKPITLGEVLQMQNVDKGKIHMATRCYSYQACEADDWETTLAYWITTRIYYEIGARLPGGGEAGWGAPVEFTKPAPEVFSLTSLMS